MFLGHHLRDAGRGVVQDRSQGKPDGQAGQPGPGRRPLHHDRVFATCPRHWPGKPTQGQLRIWAGSPAIHIFDVDFLAGGPARAPCDPVPCGEEEGALPRRQWCTSCSRTRENALKFEMFIFDVLPLGRALDGGGNEPARGVRAAEERDGARLAGDRAPSNQQSRGRLARKDSAKPPRRSDGNAAMALEISPLYALDAEELAAKVNATLPVNEPLYLGDARQDNYMTVRNLAAFVGHVFNVPASVWARYKRAPQTAAADSRSAI